MTGQSERSYLKWVGVAGVCCGVILAIYRLVIYPCTVEEAVPPATAIVFRSLPSEDKDFSIIDMLVADKMTLVVELKRGRSDILSIDSAWEDGLWMLQQIGTGTYGWSVAKRGGLPVAARSIAAQEPVSIYRGVPLYALSGRIWVAQYRNLWLAGTQSRLVEAMIAALEGGQKEWQGVADTGITVSVENLSAFFSGRAGGALSAWLQELEKSDYQLHLTALGRERLQVRGRLHSRDNRSAIPSMESIAEHLPIQLAWSTAAPVVAISEQNPLSRFINPWLGKHKVVAQLALPGEYPDNRVLLISVNGGDPSDYLIQLSSELGVLEEFSYQMFEVRQVLGDGLFSSFIRGGLRNPYIVFLGDYVALSPSRAGIEQVMNARALGLSLLQDATFNNRVALDSTKRPAAWWYSHHGRSARLVDQLMIGEDIGAGTFWSGWSSTTGAIYEDGSISLDSRRQEQRSGLAAALVWQLPLEETIIAGPFLLEQSILVQEASSGLVCRGLEGNVRWVYPLRDSIKGAPQPLYLDGGRRAGIAFAAGDQVHVLDWQGKAHAPFPLRVPSGIQSPLEVSVLEQPVVYALWVASRDQRIYGYDQDGRFLTGWGPNQVADTLVSFPVQHSQYQGQDYITVLSESGRLYLFDRLGRLKLDTLPLRAKAISPPYLRLGPQQQRIAVGQSDGYVQVFNLEGQTFRLSLMPNHEGAVQFRFEDIVGDERGDYLMWDNASLRLFSYEGTDFREVQKWSVGAPLHSVQYKEWKDEGLLMGFSADARRLWVLGMDGKVQPGFPVAADAPAAVLAEEERLLILCYYEGSLYLYEL